MAHDDPANDPGAHEERIKAARRSSYDRDAILECARGTMFGPGNPQLPLPPMLMLDRITQVSEDGGEHGRGHISAAFDIRPDLWFFDCHFEGDPVMPGCLGLDALWQMTGFALGWMGLQGRGRALGVGEVKLTAQVTPDRKLVEYGVDFKRVVRGRLKLGIADGWMTVDGERAYTAKDLKVGLFRD